MIKLFISGFPLDMGEMELAQLLAPYGDISTMKIVRDKKTRVCKGYAFIEMTSQAGAAAVVSALDGTKMKGKVLTLNIHDEQPGRQ